MFPLNSWEMFTMASAKGVGTILIPKTLECKHDGLIKNWYVPKELKVVFLNWRVLFVLSIIQQIRVINNNNKHKLKQEGKLIRWMYSLNEFNVFEKKQS